MPIKPCHSVWHLLFSWKPPGMVTSPFPLDGNFTISLGCIPETCMHPENLLSQWKRIWRGHADGNIPLPWLLQVPFSALFYHHLSPFHTVHLAGLVVGAGSSVCIYPSINSAMPCHGSHLAWDTALQDSCLQHITVPQPAPRHQFTLQLVTFSLAPSCTTDFKTPKSPVTGSLKTLWDAVAPFTQRSCVLKYELVPCISAGRTICCAQHPGWKLVGWQDSMCLQKTLTVVKEPFRFIVSIPVKLHEERFLSQTCIKKTDRLVLTSLKTCDSWACGRGKISRTARKKSCHFPLLYIRLLGYNIHS